jgi:hypothetical protein
MMNKPQDKLRIYFYWRDQLYEKWLNINYPPDLINNSEHKQAFTFNFVQNTGLPELKRWYKEITNEEYPENCNTPVREIVINDKNTSVEQAMKNVKEKYGY